MTKFNVSFTKIAPGQNIDDLKKSMLDKAGFKNLSNLIKNEPIFNGKTLKDNVIIALKAVEDPELDINIYDLGLIYDIKIDENINHVNILMTLTAPTCPAADYILKAAKSAVLMYKYIETADIELTFTPKWAPELMSEEAKMAADIIGWFDK